MKKPLKRLLKSDYDLLLVEEGEVKLEWDINIIRMCDSIGIPREIIETDGNPTGIIVNLTQEFYYAILDNKEKIKVSQTGYTFKSKYGK